jgi:hypothetical protein
MPIRISRWLTYHGPLKEGSMKTDSEVLLMKRERLKGKTQQQAAARAGMSVRTARKYERAGTLPGHMRPQVPDLPRHIAVLSRSDDILSVQFGRLIQKLEAHEACVCMVYYQA